MRAPTSAKALFDPDQPLRLHPAVALRDESFGALAYHHGTRRLVFLKSPELVTLVRRLSEFESAEAALTAIIPRGQRDRYVAALASLHRSEILSGR